MCMASEVFVKALENEQVEYILGAPGEENIDFLEAVRKSNIKFILTRHEQGAGFMADIYGRLTGRAGVCLSTIGPGATNLQQNARASIDALTRHIRMAGGDRLPGGLQ